MNGGRHWNTATGQGLLAVTRSQESALNRFSLVSSRSQPCQPRLGIAGLRAFARAVSSCTEDPASPFPALRDQFQVHFLPQSLAGTLTSPTGKPHAGGTVLITHSWLRKQGICGHIVTCAEASQTVRLRTGTGLTLPITYTVPSPAPGTQGRL